MRNIKIICTDKVKVKKNRRGIKAVIGILTFYWADDYGAMLQAYALKQSVKKISGDVVKIIPYAPIKLTGRYWVCPVLANQIDGKLKYYINLDRFKRNIFYIKKYLIRRRNMRYFRHSYLIWKPAKRRPDKLSLKKYSCVFVGSDQVWNPEITVGLDDAYIGNIKKGNCRLISYGASFGGDSIPEKYHSKFAEAVNENFASISLREKSALPFVKNILSREAIDVLDPTLLLEKEEWEEMGILPEEKGYILFTYTEFNKQMVEYLKKLSTWLHKRVIQLSMPWDGQEEDWIDIKLEGGPAEFIGYFQNADCIVTNSFHGMVFSVLLEKQFIVFSHSNKNARIESFLEKLNLKMRLIKKGQSAIKESMTESIDWKSVKVSLEKERVHSIDFIRDNCQ